MVRLEGQVKVGEQSTFCATFSTESRDFRRAKKIEIKIYLLVMHNVFMSETTTYAISNLTKSYNKTTVLNVEKLSMSQGQFVVLMGKNGSGKSTLMRLLAQQELFESGEFFFHGQPINSSTVHINSQTVFISEDLELPFTVKLQYWVETFKKMYPGYDDQILKRLTDSFEIDIKKPFHGLSRGQKMKAIFSLQAPKCPQIYILDEITSVLDAGSRWTLMQFLKEESQRGCLVIMSTNIASEMQGFASDLMLIENGRIAFESRTNNLKEHFRKIRVGKNADHNAIKELGARKISFNKDETWIYLHVRQGFDQGLEISGVEEDKREITIADVQSYFTAGEVG